jgi:hypothetical protein
LERLRLLAQDKKSKGKKSVAPVAALPAPSKVPTLKSPRGEGAGRPTSGKSTRSEKGNESPRSSKPEEKVYLSSWSLLRQIIGHKLTNK